MTMNVNCDNYIDGKSISVTASSYTPVYNPSRGEVIAQAPECDAKAVDQAVQAAKKAFPAWAETPVFERARVMFRFAHLLETHFDEIAKIVTREHGKTPEEAKGDVRRGIEMVELACHAPTLLTGASNDIRSESAPESRRSISRRWFRSGCFPSPSSAATRSSSSLRRKSR